MTASSRHANRRRRLAGWLACALGLLAVLVSLPEAPAGAGSTAVGFPVRVELSDEPGDLARLNALEVDIDAVFDGWARIYVAEKQYRELRLAGFKVSRLPDRARKMAALTRKAPPPQKGVGGMPTTYHDYDSMTAALEAVAADHPDITRLTSLGQSVQGRELWALEITDNPDQDEDEPELAYIAAMHGDEVVGRELLINLIHYLTDRYATDARVARLVDEAELWFVPSMNPDGTAAGQRWNANGVDLNRDFPDQFTDPDNTGTGRQPETAAVMAWAADRRIVLSASLHGGTLVANYPFDGNVEGFNVHSPTPDQETFVSLARTYADNNPPMSTSNAHPAFDDGITNGADWVMIRGGLQDWAYVWNGDFDLTLELGHEKWPDGTELPSYWSDNLESMLAYLERGLEGVRGIVTDALTGLPVAATVTFEQNPNASRTDPARGDYHRVLLPETYSATFSALGYHDKQVTEVVVGGGDASRYDVALDPLPTELEHAGTAVDDGAEGDGWLDLGQVAELVVALRNLGGTATALRGRLESTGWEADVIRRDATYDDLAPGQVGHSRAPHPEVLMRRAIPPGRKVGFAVHWESLQGRGTAGPFFLEVGAPQCLTASAADLPQPIIDFGQTTSDVIVPQVLEIGEVQVTVDIRHTYVADLQVTLESPTGTVLTLHDRTGGGTDDVVGTYDVDLFAVNPLATLAGESSAGRWRLRVRDDASGDQGSVEAWSVRVCGHPLDATTPEMKLSTADREGDAIVLGWWPYPGLTRYQVYRSTDPSSAATFIDVTAEDDDATDTRFADATPAPILYYLVTGVGPYGEGPLGHSEP